MPPDEMLELIEAAQGGDRQALDGLLRSSLPMVYHVAARTLPPADADDVVQETMIRAVTSLPKLREPRRFRSWLLSITLREVRRRGTRLSEQRKRYLDLDTERLRPDADHVEDQLVDRLDRSRQRRQLTIAAQWLDRDDRELLDLWWLSQAGILTRSEIADTLAISPAHARVRVQRLRERLETARRIEAAIETTGGTPCPDLAELVGAWSGERSALWRRRFARHVHDCRQCTSTTSDLLPAEKLLAVLPLLVPPSPGLNAIGPVKAALTGTPTGNGPAIGARDFATSSLGKSAAVVATLAVATVAGLAFLRDAPPRPQPVTAATSPAVPVVRPVPRLSSTPTPTPTPSARRVGAGTGGPWGPAAKMPPTQGGRYLYVSDKGDDSNSGRSRDTPFRTLRHAADRTKPGDTVLVDGGVYSAPGRSNVLAINNSGAPGRWITFAAYPNTRPVILQSGWQGINVHASFIIVSGFTVNGNVDELTPEQRAQAKQGNTSDQAINGLCIGVNEQKTANPPRRPTHVEIVRNTLRDCPLAGISTQLADYVTIEYNIASGNSLQSPYGGSGISLHGSWNSDGNTRECKMVVRGNVVHDNRNLVPSTVSNFTKITDGNGIIVDSFRNERFRGFPLYQTPYAACTLIENNTSYNNGGAGVVVYGSDHVRVAGNTLYHNSRTPGLRGDLAVSEATDVTLANNIIAATPKEDALRVSRSAADVSINNNILSKRADVPLNRTNLITDPQFVDPADADFRLRATSPAINGGTTTGAPRVDGTTATRDARPDIGAHEHR